MPHRTSPASEAVETVAELRRAGHSRERIAAITGKSVSTVDRRIAAAKSHGLDLTVADDVEEAHAAPQDGLQRSDPLADGYHLTYARELDAFHRGLGPDPNKRQGPEPLGTLQPILLLASDWGAVEPGSRELVDHPSWR